MLYCVLNPLNPPYTYSEEVDQLGVLRGPSLLLGEEEHEVSCIHAQTR
jgi:hypothetical protein